MNGSCSFASNKERLASFINLNPEEFEKVLQRFNPIYIKSNVMDGSAMKEVEVEFVYFDSKEKINNAMEYLNQVYQLMGGY